MDMVARLIIGMILAVAAVMLQSVMAHAAEANKGLYIAPLRQDVKLTAGSTQSGKFIVGNYTDKAMTITLSVKRFSVADFSYAYQFHAPDNNWVQFTVPTVTLSPGEKYPVDFTLAVPANASPGGYYFSLIASTSAQASVTVQAATLLYVSVDGGLTRSIEIQNSQIPRLVGTPSVPFQYDAKDTGNVYVDATFFAGLHGQRSEMTRTLLPNVPRRITGSLPAPFWPGIYQLSYGFKADYMTSAETRTATIIYVPPWAMMFGAVLVGVLVWLLVSLRRHRQRKA